jgi:antirestriction protein ArdC
MRLPPREGFIGSPTSTQAECYASTKLHELVHWTSVEARDRELGKHFPDDAYAMGAFVAELGTAFLCTDLGITDAARPDHSSYLESWPEGRQRSSSSPPQRLPRPWRF